MSAEAKIREDKAEVALSWQASSSSWLLEEPVRPLKLAAAAAGPNRQQATSLAISPPNSLGCILHSTTVRHQRHQLPPLDELN